MCALGCVVLTETIRTCEERRPKLIWYGTLFQCIWILRSMYGAGNSFRYSFVCVFICVLDRLHFRISILLRFFVVLFGIVCFGRTIIQYYGIVWWIWFNRRMHVSPLQLLKHSYRWSIRSVIRFVYTQFFCLQYYWDGCATMRQTSDAHVIIQCGNIFSEYIKGDLRLSSFWSIWHTSYLKSFVE